MPSKVTLTVVQGALKGKSYVFDDHTTCIMGRAADCNPQLPNDQEHKKISRHHCLVEFNPPQARIRDFGSLNGTYVNGERIGKREKGQVPGQAELGQFPEHDLKAGDQIKLGGTVFEVSTYAPAVCGECAEEIPEDKRGESRQGAGENYLCPDCRKKAEEERKRIAEQEKQKQAVIAPSPKPMANVCKSCGKKLSESEIVGVKGEPICRACREKPLNIIKMLLDLAAAGKKELVSIKGYKTIKEIGRGGMGAVYLAENRKNGEQVALKVMLPQVATNQKAVDGFLRESRITKALRHKNIVQLKNCGCAEGTFFFTLEFCEGGSVDQLMVKRGGRIPFDEAMEIIFQALDALDYAHKAKITTTLADGKTKKVKGLVHRDIKPQNIFLTGGDKPRVKVADFGLAKAFATAGLTGMTATGMAGGTPCFMPVQQLANFKYSKPDVDVWAIAATLYNMLTGAFPKNFRQGVDPYMVIIKEPSVPIRERNPSIPEKAAHVIDTALIDRPQIPYGSIAEFTKALKQSL